MIRKESISKNLLYQDVEASQALDVSDAKLYNRGPIGRWPTDRKGRTLDLLFFNEPYFSFEQ